MIFMGKCPICNDRPDRSDHWSHWCHPCPRCTSEHGKTQEWMCYITFIFLMQNFNSNRSCIQQPTCGPGVRGAPSSRISTGAHRVVPCRPHRIVYGVFCHKDLFGASCGSVGSLFAKQQAHRAGLSSLSRPLAQEQVVLCVLYEPLAPQPPTEGQHFPVNLGCLALWRPFCS